MKITPLIDFRKREGLSIEGLADRFRINKRTLIRWEQGQTPIPLKRLPEVMDQTGLSRRELRPDFFEAAE